MCLEVSFFLLKSENDEVAITILKPLKTRSETIHFNIIECLESLISMLYEKQYA